MDGFLSERIDRQCRLKLYKQSNAFSYPFCAPISPSSYSSISQSRRAICPNTQTSLAMQLTYSIPFLTLLPTFITALAPTHLIYEAPNDTWLENLAVRGCGSILLTTTTSPDLWLINPFTPSPTPNLLHRFSSGSFTVGITETIPDTFQVIVASATLENNSIYTVSFPINSDVPLIHLAATVSGAGLLNGLATLNPNTVLAADSYKGVVWAIDTLTGASRIAISDPLMAPLTTSVFESTIGINGIKLRGSTLYFTNSAQAIFAKMEIQPNGTAINAAEVIAHSPPGTTYDDFALDGRGDAFVATSQGNTIEEIGRAGEPQIIVAGNINSTEIAEPTAAQFGRTLADRDVLYVTTAGGLEAPINGDERVGGQLVAVDTRGLWSA